MAIVAPAGKTVRNKNLMLIGLFTVFAVWFMKDAYWGWPAGDDALVRRMIADPVTNSVDIPTLKEWPGWNQASSAQRKQLQEIVERNHFEGWKQELDITQQKWIMAGLFAGTVVAISWFFRGQKRRAFVDETGLSPKPGLMIPWPQITAIDNTQWKKSGIVTIRYKDGHGVEKSAVLDDYLLDNLPPLLKEVSARATQAQVISPPETTPA